MKTQKGYIRFLLIILLFPAIALISTNYQTYTDIQTIKSHYQSDIVKIENRKWDLIEDTINENIDKSKIQTNYIKRNIISNIYLNYNGNFNKLYLDLTQRRDSSIFYIFNNAIDNVYLNNNSENNRVFIADKTGILADKGFIASTNKSSRDWDIEINSKNNINLAKTSVDIILSEQNSLAIWPSETTTKLIENNNISYPSMAELKNLYNRNGYNAFKNYNILVPSYITKDGDIFGVPDVNDHGIKNDNNKIIIVQEFNIYDSIAIHKGVLDSYDMMIVQYKDNEQQVIDRKILEDVFMSIILITTFLAVLKGANNCIKWGGDDEFSDGCNNSRS